jgi:preprotein translocase subunit SecG
MNAFVVLILVIHAVISLGLIVFILLHSGKGTGVSSMFGAMPSTSSGTGVIEKNLDRITIGLAVGFACTSILLMLTYRP